MVVDGQSSHRVKCRWTVKTEHLGLKRRSGHVTLLYTSLLPFVEAHVDRFATQMLLRNLYKYYSVSGTEVFVDNNKAKK